MVNQDDIHKPETEHYISFTCLGLLS